MPNRQGWIGACAQQAEVGRTHIQQAETDGDMYPTSGGRKGLIPNRQKWTETHT